MTTNLIPTIHPGKRYLLTYRRIEAPVCPCGREWLDKLGTSEVVVILNVARPDSMISCYHCHRPIWRAEGWYAVETVSGEWGFVPYTLLSEIPEENYDAALKAGRMEERETQS